MSDRDTAAPPPLLLRTNVVAGLALIALGLAAFVLSWSLEGSRGPMLGPGSLPRGTAAIIAVLGVVIAIAGVRSEERDVPRFRLRAPLFLLGGVLVFALTVRTLGLAIATPAAILVGSLASRDTRPVEILVFAVLLTAFCVGLFRYALGLPVPVAPWMGL